MKGSSKKRNGRVAIVPAIAKDAPGIAAVLHDAFPGETSHYKVRSWGAEAEKLMRCHRGWISFVALERGEVVGLIAARHLKGRSVPTIRIEWLAVHPSHQGRGLGVALIEHLMGWIAASFTEPRVRLTLRARNDVQGFYRRLGFRCYGKGWMKMVAKR